MQINLNKLLDKRVMVALSGGGDSVALLHYLKGKDIKLSAVHVHHGIRQKEADLDAAFVQQLCTNWKIPLLIKEFDVPMLASQNKKTVEEMGREVRYKLFSELLQGEIDVLVTAHHSDDNVESVLFNLLRGSALKGVCGIKEQITLPHGKIVRPMLAVTKGQILAYLQRHNLQWREDSSNQENKYTRNFIRNVMLQGVGEYFPQYAKHIYNFCQAVQQDEAYLQQLASKQLTVENGRVFFAATLPKPLFFRASTQAVALLAENVAYTAQNLQDIYQLQYLQNGKKITLPKQIVAVRAYDKIVFYKESNVNSGQSEEREKGFCIPFQLGAFTVDGQKYSIQQVESVEGNTLKAGKALYISGDNLQGVCIRTRQSGDRFSKFSGGTKKLKAYFIDKKIDVHRRDSIPLLARGQEILAIFGVEIAKSVQVTKDTHTILQILEEKDD